MEKKFKTGVRPSFTYTIATARPFLQLHNRKVSGTENAKAMFELSATLKQP
jgi:hypothetical protein